MAKRINGIPASEILEILNLREYGTVEIKPGSSRDYSNASTRPIAYSALQKRIAFLKEQIKSDKPIDTQYDCSDIPNTDTND